MAVGGEWAEGTPEEEPEVEVVYDRTTEPEAEYEEMEPEEAPPVEAVARRDRSVYAMLSGLGFFVATLLLLFLIIPVGGTILGLTVLGMGIGTAIPYLWLAGDLRIRPRQLRRSQARFLAGPMIGVLAVVLYALFAVANPNWLLLSESIGVVAITLASVSMFLYSMLWKG